MARRTQTALDFEALGTGGLRCLSVALSERYPSEVRKAEEPVGLCSPCSTMVEANDRLSIASTTLRSCIEKAHADGPTGGIVRHKRYPELVIEPDVVPTTRSLSSPVSVRPVLAMSQPTSTSTSRTRTPPSLSECSRSFSSPVCLRGQLRLLCRNRPRRRQPADRACHYTRTSAPAQGEEPFENQLRDVV